MNIELLAAEIAAAVPELARDSVTNRAERIKGMIANEQSRHADISGVPRAHRRFTKDLPIYFPNDHR